MPMSLDEAYLDFTEHLEKRQSWPDSLRTHHYRASSDPKGRIQPSPFNACMHISEICLITLWNNLLSVKVTRTTSFPRRQRLTRQTFLQSCLTTVRALLFTVTMPAARLRSLGHLLRKLWERCGFVLSRRPCWLPVQVRENQEETKI